MEARRRGTGRLREEKIDRATVAAAITAVDDALDAETGADDARMRAERDFFEPLRDDARMQFLLGVAYSHGHLPELAR